MHSRLPPPPPGRRRGIEISLWQLIAGGVTLILIFLLGFQMGGRREDDTGALQGTAHQAARRVASQRKEVKECYAALKAPALSHPTEQDVREGADAIDKSLSDLEAEAQRISLQKDECETERENAERNWDDADATHKGLIDILTKQAQHLATESRQLEFTVGMRSNLLALLVRKSRLRNLQLKQKLGDPLPPAFGAEYDLMVVERNKGGLAQLEDTASLLPSEKIALMELERNFVQFKYNPAVHTDIFIPTVDGLRLSRPTYFNRTGTGPVVRGTYIVKESEKSLYRNVAVAGTASVIRGMYNVALCAYRNNVANFTHPDIFFHREYNVGSLSRMSSILDTPLVSFCVDCINQRFTKLFLDACRGDRVEDIYGGEDFWSMRSMIRFQPELVMAAQRQMQGLSLTPDAKVLAVTFRQSDKLKSLCTFQQRKLPLRPYLWVRNNYRDYEPVQVNNESVARQCLPGLEDLQQGIKAVAARNKLSKFDVVLLSVEKGYDTSVFDKMDLYADRVVVLRPDTAAEDAVELMMSASANYLLANRFSEHSQVLIEMFLLRHQLSPYNIHFF